VVGGGGKGFSPPPVHCGDLEAHGPGNGGDVSKIVRYSLNFGGAGSRSVPSSGLVA
jgi:hypothetical protein